MIRRAGKCRTNDAVILDFFGTPASGKTCAAERLVSTLSQKELPVDASSLTITKSARLRRVAYKLRFMFQLFVSRPRLCCRATMLVKHSRPDRPVSFAKVLFNWLYVIGWIDRETDKGSVILMDQGVAQAAWSTAYYARLDVDELLRAFIPQMLSEFSIGRLLVIHLDTDAEKIRKRLRYRTRGQSPLDVGRGGNLERAMAVTEVVGTIFEKESPPVELHRFRFFDDEALAEMVNAVRVTRSQ